MIYTNRGLAINKNRGKVYILLTFFQIKILFLKNTKNDDFRQKRPKVTKPVKTDCSETHLYRYPLLSLKNTKLHKNESISTLFSKPLFGEYTYSRAGGVYKTPINNMYTH